MRVFSILFLIVLKYYIDLQKGITASLATIPLGGSSRTTGGFTRGRAHGNLGNIGDTDNDEPNDIILTSTSNEYNGIVWYCNHTNITPPLKSRDVDFGFAHKVQIGRTVRSLLKEIGALFNTLTCKFLFLLLIYTKYII